MFDTELEFDTQIEAIRYATDKGMLVAIDHDVVAVNPENGKRYYLGYATPYFYWERT